MSTHNTCPETSVLRELLKGTFPENQQAELAEHVGACAKCRQELDCLAGGGEWLAPARSAESVQIGPDEGLQGLIERLRTEVPGARAASDPRVDLGGRSLSGSDSSLAFLDPPDSPQSIGRLGPYRILGVIGQGATGVVFKAEDPTLHRVVAIKVLSPPLAASGASRERFLHEAQAAAAITHDHVVTIHAVAEAKGLPFLVMEYIAGVSLQDRIQRTGPLKVAEVLRIGMQTASGLSAAHAQGLVHRDIKPANILLENGIERVKITDFGLAKAMHEAQITQEGVVAGTPQYMSPEQARGEPVDHRSDLFSLGCVMYAMCAGRSPFRAESSLAAMRRVCDDAPRPIRQVNPQIPEWLEQIINRLLAKDPSERFQTAGEVAELLGKYLAHVQQPLVAPLPTWPGLGPLKPPTARSPRRRWLVATAGGLMAAALALSALAVWRTIAAKPDPSGHADVPKDMGNLVARIPKDAKLKVAGNDLESIWTDAEEHTISLPEGEYKLTLVRGDTMLREGTVRIAGKGRAFLDCAEDAALCPFRPQPLPKDELLGHGSGAWGVAYSHDGTKIASTDGDGNVMLWKFGGDDHEEPILLGTHEKFVRCAAFSPDDKLLATASEDGNVRLWDAAEGEPLARLRAHESGAYWVAFSPDGGTIATCGGDGGVRLWDAETRVSRAILRGHKGIVASLAFSPDGKSLATAGWEDRTARVWNVAARKQRLLFSDHADGIHAVAFAPDGRTVATAGIEGIVRVWDARAGNLLRRFDAEDEIAAALAFSPDGKTLAAGTTQSVRRWDLSTGALVDDFHAHWSQIRCLAFSPDSLTMATASLDGSVRLWDLARRQSGFPKKCLPAPKASLPYSGTGRWLINLAVSPKGDAVAAAPGSQNVCVWSTADYRQLACFPVAYMCGRSLAYAPDGKTFMVCSSRSYPKPPSWLFYCDTDDYQVMRRFDGPPGDATLAVSPSGRQVAISHGQSQIIRCCDATTGSELWRTKSAPYGNAGSPVFSPDGSRMAVATEFGYILLLDAATGKPNSEPLRHGECSYLDLAFSSTDEKTLVSAGADKIVKFWDVARHTQLAAVARHQEQVYSVAFSSDGKLLVTTGGAYMFDKQPWRHRGEVKIWDVANRRPICEWAAHGISACDAMFLPDRKTLVTSGRDCRVRLWDVDELLNYGAQQNEKSQTDSIP